MKVEGKTLKQAWRRETWKGSNFLKFLWSVSTGACTKNLTSSLLICIRQASDLNLRENNYFSLKFFVVFYSISRQIATIIPWIRQRSLLCTYTPIHSHCYPVIWLYIYALTSDWLWTLVREESDCGKLIYSCLNLIWFILVRHTSNSIKWLTVPSSVTNL
jgi:hypothetical protein